MTALDASLALEAEGHGLSRGRADPAYEANTGMFGGWTAALLLKSVLTHPLAEGSASAITVNFIKRVAPGAEILLRAERIGGGRSIAHWRTSLTLEGEDDPAATATVITTRRRDSDCFTEIAMPDAPPPDQLPVFRPPGPFGAQMEIRYAIGANPFNQKATRSLGWQREDSGRRIDAIGLVFLADLGWPRIFALGEGPRASSTITMSVYFHATDAELSSIGYDWILCDMVGTRIEASTVGSKADLWSRGGALLATTEQLCWVR